MKRTHVAIALALVLAACGAGNDPDPAQYGADPALPERQGGLLPSMKIAKPAQWGDQKPTVPQGYTIVGFGRGRIVYLTMRDASGLHLARVRLRDREAQPTP